MRTPIQEVYAQLRASKESDSFGVAYGVDWLLENEKLILEKEEEAMCEFALKSFFEITNNITKMSADGIHSKLALSIIKQQYEETFNTKENG